MNFSCGFHGSPGRVTEETKGGMDMKLMTFTIATGAAFLLWSAAITLANPALMQKNKPGYPYPGTKATDTFGSKAMDESTASENRLEGIAPGQTVPKGSFAGKSLLPPAGDPARLDPRPELEGFPIHKKIHPGKSPQK